MKLRHLISFLIATAAVLTIVGAVAAGPATVATQNVPLADAAEIIDGEVTAEALPEVEIEQVIEIDDCQLQCHQEFTACRQGAGNSGGPGFPMGAFEACVDELEACLADECGIGC